MAGQADSKKKGRGDAEFELDAERLFTWIHECGSRARFIAYRLGKLTEYRRGDPDVIREIAEGFEFYWDTFQHPDYKLQPVISYTLNEE